jgi:DNA-directed RNA polymerase subunit RPC12/RpoP
MPILSVCPTCGFRILISKRTLGKQTRCRRCGSTFFPGGKPPGEMVSSAETYFAHRCPSCAACIGVPTRYEGRRVKCPDCRQVHPALRTEGVTPPPREKTRPEVPEPQQPVEVLEQLEAEPEDWVLAPEDELQRPRRHLSRKQRSFLTTAFTIGILVCVAAALGIWWLAG